MTDEEICERLRSLAESTTYFSVCKVAADEIERLMAENKRKPITDDELQKLVAELRHPIQRNERYYEPLCARAANEIEWLAKDRGICVRDAEGVNYD